MRCYCTVGFIVCLASTRMGLAQSPGSPSDEGLQIQTRGPIHEAFAEPVVFDPKPGVAVTRKPPAAIEELPPEQKPDGVNVIWISGYWAWDDDRGDFIWISGIWRNVPPGRQWNPGYWMPAGDGYQWISGYWAQDQTGPVEYLPAPPETLETGPSSEPPRVDDIWVPGIWMWQQEHYLWRPGYWQPPQPNWIWTPACYMWRPSGYLYVGGYWDHVMPARGLLFAPVYLAPAVYARPAFVYRPSVVVNTDVLVSHLFVRPLYDHYYFGDYYPRTYFQKGIYPFYSFHNSKYGYDPVYATYSATNRRLDPKWEQRIRDEYHFRRDHEEARPPRVYIAARDRVETHGEALKPLATPLTQVTGTREVPVRLNKLEPGAWEDVKRRVGEVRKFETQRQRMELQAAPRSPLAQTKQKDPQPLRLEVPRSPLVGRPMRELERTFTPPASPKAPAAAAAPLAKPRPRGNKDREPKD